jgi:hypothetical protein
MIVAARPLSAEGQASAENLTSTPAPLRCSQSLHRELRRHKPAGCKRELQVYHQADLKI